ncbi:MAG: hypothetical protein A3I68_01785 [Candidatus Melainabacteria bacterium RIFCSPLOWO2_02_FULL_35_15]|nr:MAG: hypothetical protein A3F80_09580 [Candidatus Melainabacteria bacterium RIFCSPLOWO2_12_FULL_35_11]OGI14285.1 MAG: hypothetical protein A3I68_01785 [Candidatus Melainabacteria bacterium RIFCSPLOWO2_02_FULL_35_15]
MREINANFKRFISIFKKEDDLDYRASVDEEIAKCQAGAKSVEVIIRNGLIITPQGENPGCVKVKLVYTPQDEDSPEDIQTNLFRGGSQHAALFEAIQRFNNIAEWKSLPEEVRKEAREQYKQEKPFLNIVISFAL